MANQMLSFSMIRRASLLIALLLTLTSHVQAATLNELSELFGTRPFTKAMTISPDGKHFAVILEQGERQSLRILHAETGKVTNDINFDDSWRFGRMFWANNERVLVQPYYQPDLTNTIIATGALYGVNVDGSKERFLLGPSAGAQMGSMAGRDQGRLAALVLDTYDRNRRKVAVQVFDSSKRRPSTALLDVYTGRLTKRTYGPGVRFCQFTLDSEARPRFCLTADQDTDLWQVYYREPSSDEWSMVHTAGVWDDEFSIQGELGTGEFLATWPHPETSIKSLYALSVNDGQLKKTLLHSDPVFDSLSVYGSSSRGYSRVLYANPKPEYVYLNQDPELEDVHRGLVATFPGKFISFTSMTDDYRLAIVSIGGAESPRKMYLLDIKTRQMRLVDDSYSEQAKYSTAMEPVVIEARDGVTLHGHLSRTTHEKSKGLVVNIHGGPHGPFDIWGYNKEIQFLTSIGLDVLQVNFRGSGGFGLDFMRSGYGEWGRKMQDDVTDATRWAIDQGIVDSNKICIYGASYGAYAALAGVAFEPGLYRCAAGHVGVYDLVELRKSGDIPERKSGVRFLNRVIGNDEENLVSRSPSEFAGRIRVPILLTAGLDDERAPPVQTRIMAKALDDAGWPATVSYQAREGHGFVSEEAEIARLEQLGTFILNALANKTVSGAG